MFATAATSMIVGSLLLVSAPAMPDRSVDKMCTASATTTGDDTATASCKRDERAARESLVKEWDTVPARFRSTCLESINDVAPSFVTLKSCIDNNMEVQKTQ